MPDEARRMEPSQEFEEGLRSLRREACLSPVKRTSEKRTSLFRRDDSPSRRSQAANSPRRSRFSERKSIAKLALETVANYILPVSPDEGLEHLGSEPPFMAMNRLLNFHLKEEEKRFIEKYLDEATDLDVSTAELQDMLEKELELIGATAIEDELQDKVSESVQSIRDCGVKVWMLTGDKKETAINIGYSCGLIGDSTEIIDWEVGLRRAEEQAARRAQAGGSESLRVAPETSSKGDSNDAARTLNHSSEAVGGKQSSGSDNIREDGPAPLAKWSHFAAKGEDPIDHSQTKLSECSKEVKKGGRRAASESLRGERCLVATGDDLLACPDEATLLEVVTSCSTVICCRVSPKQKQEMVWLMRKNRKTTMAVGDGANDVNMITTAHVGVGIKGVEGAQAALCSDYAVSEFRLLPELLQVHGVECYRRNAELVLFNFFKNLLLSLPQLWLGFHNRFSATPFYDPFMYQLYNVFFTSVPILLYAAFDQQHAPAFARSHPQVYHFSRANRLFSLRRILLAFLEIPVLSLAVTFFTTLLLASGPADHGFAVDLNGVGMAVFFQVVLISNLKVATLMYTHSIGMYLVLAVSSLLLLACAATLARVFPHSIVAQVMATSIFSYAFWATVLIGVGIFFVFDLALTEFRRLRERKDLRQVHFDPIEMPILLKQSREQDR